MLAAANCSVDDSFALLDRGFYRRRWQLLLLAWVVKFPLSEVVAALAMDYDDFHKLFVLSCFVPWLVLGSEAFGSEVINSTVVGLE